MAMLNCGLQMILGFVLGMGLFAVLIGIKKIRVRQAIGMVKREEKLKEEIFESAKAEMIKAKEETKQKAEQEPIKKRGRPKMIKEMMESEENATLDKNMDGFATTETNNKER